jgi:1-aminocyclopropane-1-carboxylate deaminase/D-cysteine desulfhydrase-like pyridoxal-dependent ACC family enzyme
MLANNWKGDLMYKMQFVNAYNQNVLREQLFKSSEKIMEMIMSLEKTTKDGLEIFLMDSEKRMLDSKFVTYKIVEEDDMTVYKVFFKTKIAELQPLYRE